MANRVEIIHFKSQKNINQDRKEKLEKRKADIRRRVEAIKNSNDHKRDKAKA